MRGQTRWLFWLLIFFSGAVQAFDWDYSSFRYELTNKAVTGSRADFGDWAKAPRESFVEQAARVVEGGRVSLVKTVERDGDVARLTELTFRIEGVADSGALSYVVVVAVPKSRNGRSIPIVAFDGHGDCGGECSGDAPRRMFSPSGFANHLLKSGYTVLGFPTAMHKPFEAKAKRYDYPLIWASLANEVLRHPYFFAGKDKRYIAVGSAIGGLTALTLGIIDPRVSAVVVNGSFFPLELTRREYRIKDHPFCHDFRMFNTYTGVYALLAPKPLMIQVGQKDALWLGNGAVPASSWFSGMRRGATVDETLGASLVLGKIWEKFATPYQLLIHEGGHEEFDSAQVDGFIRKVSKRIRAPAGGEK
jgi:hypothetical protein